MEASPTASGAGKRNHKSGIGESGRMGATMFQMSRPPSTTEGAASSTADQCPRDAGQKLIIPITTSMKTIPKIQARELSMLSGYHGKCVTWC